MKKLTNKEEEIMQVLWQLEKAFVNDILNALPKPKPHYNTVSTIIQKLKKKGYVDHEAFGRNYRYFPLISKEVYSKTFLGDKITSFFDNSYKGMVAFFAKEEKLSVEDLKEIIDMIEKRKK